MAKWVRVKHQAEYCSVDELDAKKAYILDWREKTFNINDVTAEWVKEEGIVVNGEKLEIHSGRLETGKDYSFEYLGCQMLLRKLPDGTMDLFEVIEPDPDKGLELRPEIEERLRRAETERSSENVKE